MESYAAKRVVVVGLGASGVAACRLLARRGASVTAMDAKPAERLSADAPVPVLHVRRTEDRPGGAANVAMDLVALGASVVAIGVTGQDAEGRLLKGALERERVDASGLVEDASRPTTVKRNLIGLAQTRHPQKMFRVDYETRDPLSAETADTRRSTSCERR